MGIATEIVQVSPIATTIEHVISTDLFVTWRLQTVGGAPLANKTVRIYIDHGTASYEGPRQTDSNGQVTFNIGRHNALYVGSTWDFDVRFAGDATHDASSSPYIYLHIVAESGNSCSVEGAHQGGTLCWDGVTYVGGEECSGGVWVPNDDVCPIQPICDEGQVRNPVFCGDGSTVYLEECVGNAWVATYDECPGEVICTDGEVSEPFECDDGTIIHLKVCEGNQWVGSGEICDDGTPLPVNNWLIAGGMVAFALVTAFFVFKK